MSRSPVGMWRPGVRTCSLRQLWHQTAGAQVTDSSGHCLVNDLFSPSTPTPCSVTESRRVTQFVVTPANTHRDVWLAEVRGEWPQRIPTDSLRPTRGQARQRGKGRTVLPVLVYRLLTFYSGVLWHGVLPQFLFVCLRSLSKSRRLAAGRAQRYLELLCLHPPACCTLTPSRRKQAREAIRLPCPLTAKTV